MAITVEFDQIDGMSAVLTENGWEITRTAIVKGLTGTKSAKIISAVNSAEVIAAGMPEIYDSHPDKSSAKLREIRPSIIDTDTVKCSLVYRSSGVITNPPLDQTIISVGSSVQQVEVNKDTAGDLSVSHTYTADEILKFGPFNPALPMPVPQGGTISVFRPQTTYEYSRRQSASPGNYALDYVGKVNSSSWKGGAAKTWLCTGITGRSSDNGETYDVTFSFQYNPDTWNPEYVFLMPDGKPPAVTNSNPQAGPVDLKRANYYTTANFGSLPV